jgi:hypothetical protein
VSHRGDKVPVDVGKSGDGTLAVVLTEQLEPMLPLRLTWLGDDFNNLENVSLQR